MIKRNETHDMKSQTDHSKSLQIGEKNESEGTKFIQMIKSKTKASESQPVMIRDET